MDNRELERRIKTAVSHAVPDVKKDIIAACENEKGKVLPMTQAKIKKKRVWIPLVATAAAAFMILGGAIGAYLFRGGISNPVESIVMLDVNPSISLEVDKREKVTQAHALNEEAKIVIGTMELEGVKLDVAVNALIGSMVQNGYLNDVQNSILVSVQNGDRALQEKIAGYVGGALGGDGYAILSQVVNSDETLTNMAKQYGISAGKASLIREITAQDKTLTAETLAPLSVGEISLIADSRSLTLQGLIQSGETSTKSYIGSEKAKQAAFAHAGISAGDASYVSVKFDSEDGIMVYEVEFYADGVEYEYDIHAVTGEVVKAEKERENHSVSTSSTSGHSSSSQSSSSSKIGSASQGGSTSSFLNEAQAKSAALKHAGVTEQDISRYKIERDRDDGRLKYEIEFYVGNVEYDYEIDGSTGGVLKVEQSNHAGGQASSNPVSVSEAQAKSAALKHAGVTEQDISRYKIERDWDDGRLKYEIEFYVGRTEYDYEIDASTGAVLKADLDHDD